MKMETERQAGERLWKDTEPRIKASLELSFRGQPGVAEKELAKAKRKWMLQSFETDRKPMP